MTDKANEPKGSPDLARFLQDWTALWREEMQAQAGDPAGNIMSFWAETLGLARDRATTPRTEAAAAAPDARDAEIERLTRRVDELEARLAKLETPRRRRG
jgi:hypothetical protein